MDSITVAKFLLVPSIFMVSGYSSSFSQCSVPLLYNQPASVSTPILKGFYTGGAAFVVPGAMIAVASSAYLAYRVPEQRTLFATAGALAITPPLFTAAFMSKGIQRLIEISQHTTEQVKADASGEAVKLLKAWAAQNWIRAALSFSAGMIALWAVGKVTEKRARVV